MASISVKNHSKVTIHISGSQFDISIEDAKKLRDLLNKEIGDSIPQTPVNPYPWTHPDLVKGPTYYPIYPHPSPASVPYPGFDPNKVICQGIGSAILTDSSIGQWIPGATGELRP